MAEERIPLVDAPEAPQPEAEAAPAPKPKKKKKLGKLTLFFWLILLGVGAAVGLHLSGLWDGRPLFWGLIPKLPYVGKPLTEFFQIPAEYSMTAGERRAIELADWQRRLDERERSLKERDAALTALSGDLAAKMGDLDRREKSLSQAEEDAAAGSTPSAGEQELMNQVARTYQDMSARNAAAVVEQLRDSLAVELLMKLPTDARASILGKMKPQKAARLTDLMTRPRR